MDIYDKGWMGLASEKMRWAEARQAQISRNMANADTPDFVGRDVVSFEDHLRDRMQDPAASVRSEEASSSWGGSFDGNQVVLEEQQFLANSTESEHRLASELYKKAHGLLGIAISSK